MKNYNKWMVGLDMTYMDERLIKWVDFLAQSTKPEVIHFVHFEKSFEIPNYLPKDFKDEIVPPSKTQVAAIKELLSLHFKAPGNINVEIIEGQPFESLLEWASTHEIDLFIAGNKDRSKGTGILPHKLSRKLPCDVLFVPEHQTHKIEHILVPIDFSEHSKMALKTALQFNESHGAEITCIHAFQVPIGYYKSGKSYGEFADIMEGHAKKELKSFIQQFNQELRLETILVDDGRVSDMIVKKVEQDSFDLVIVGSKGQSFSSLILLGSTTEKLIQSNHQALTWVTKKEGENIGFFEAVGKI